MFQLSKLSELVMSFVHYGDTVTSIGGNVELQGSAWLPLK